MNWKLEDIDFNASEKEFNQHKKELKEKDTEIAKLLTRIDGLNYELEQQNIDYGLEIERLNKKYNKALEILADFNLPCEYDEGKIPDNYCEENCSDDYKKCWDKYIELELKGNSSNE
ncbi:MAG: hypothetical protein J6S67_10665 [Methanobrevibacter sp.]|nr:hypothetical protein [Methanobrevibacter sp.]